MRLIIQRVKQASVKVDNIKISSISRGLLVLIGIAQDDSIEDAIFLADKTHQLRIFKDNKGEINKSVLDINGSILIVSQFTLYGKCTKGRRPSFSEAAKYDKGKRLYLSYIKSLEEKKIKIATGVFGKDMDVSSVNDGPMTLLIESNKNK